MSANVPAPVVSFPAMHASPSRRRVQRDDRRRVAERLPQSSKPWASKRTASKCITFRGRLSCRLPRSCWRHRGEFSAVICLGCVIRGDTPHFDYVAGECARGIQDVALSETLPVIFGVLTTETEQQARDRISTGQRSADAAAEMIALRARVAADRISAGSSKRVFMPGPVNRFFGDLAWQLTVDRLEFSAQQCTPVRR